MFLNPFSYVMILEVVVFVVDVLLPCGFNKHGAENGVPHVPMWLVGCHVGTCTLVYEVAYSARRRRENISSFSELS